MKAADFRGVLLVPIYQFAFRRTLTLAFVGTSYPTGLQLLQELMTNRHRKQSVLSAEHLYQAFNIYNFITATIVLPEIQTSNHYSI
jgi:hypothetical protein